MIGFRPEVYEVNEGSGTVELTVSVISGVLTEAIRLNYAVSDVSTTVSDDYTVSENTLELSPMTPSVTITVDIIDDKSDELEEEFTVELSGAPVRVSFNPTVATVTIIDNDPPSISFVSDSSTIEEDAADPRHDIELTLNGLLTAEDITVTFMLAGSATRSGINADYTLTSTVVTIKAGTRTATIRLDVNDDKLYDSLESETVVLSLVSATGGVIVDATKSDHTVTITDNDPMPTVTITPASAFG